MSPLENDLLQFNQFAETQIAKGGGNQSLDELYALWRIKNPSQSVQDDVAQVIRDGEADVQSREYRPLDEFMDGFRKKHDVTQDA